MLKIKEGVNLDELSKYGIKFQMIFVEDITIVDEILKYQPKNIT